VRCVYNRPGLSEAKQSKWTAWIYLVIETFQSSEPLREAQQCRSPAP
jgi:hypothetical protein